MVVRGASSDFATPKRAVTTSAATMNVEAEYMSCLGICCMFISNGLRVNLAC